jgi:23S rRNA (uridine2479-2'-O)-methyltransferase
MSKIFNITSRDNDFLHFLSLKNSRQKRNKTKEVFIESIKAIKVLVNNNYKIDSLIYNKDNLSIWAKDFIKKTNCKHYNITSKLLNELSDKENVSELIAIIKAKPKGKDELFKFIKNKGDFLIVLLDNISNKGNLGSIIRSCDAFGVDALIISGNYSVDLYDPQVIRSSLGSVFSTSIFKINSYNEFIGFYETLKKEKKDLQLIGTSAKANENIKDIDYNKPTIVLIGNETIGLSRNYKEISNKLVKIPMSTKSVSSLNVACATSIIIYNIKEIENKK